MEKEKLLTFVKEADCVKFCQELIRIKSVNPPGDELQAAEYVVSVLKKIGLEVEVIKHNPTRASVLARLKSSRKKPGLLFNGQYRFHTRLCGKICIYHGFCGISLRLPDAYS